MSCDYHIRVNECKVCGHYEEKIIGHSAINWPFLCSGPITWTFKYWCEYIKCYKIYDEYDVIQEYDTFIEFVKSKQVHLNKSHFAEHLKKYSDTYERMSSDGYRFSVQELA